MGISYICVIISCKKENFNFFSFPLLLLFQLKKRQHKKKCWHISAYSSNYFRLTIDTYSLQISYSEVYFQTLPNYWIILDRSQDEGLNFIFYIIEHLGHLFIRPQISSTRRQLVENIAVSQALWWWMGSSRAVKGRPIERYTIVGVLSFCTHATNNNQRGHVMKWKDITDLNSRSRK